VSERLVAGRMMGKSLEEFEQACEVLIEAEQEKLQPDSAVIDLLCEAVRLSREFADRRGSRMIADERERCAALAGVAVERAVDAALGEVRRQGGADYLLREARGDGIFGAKTYLDEIGSPRGKTAAATPEQIEALTEASNRHFGLARPDTRGSAVKERPMAEASARVEVAVQSKAAAARDAILATLAMKGRPCARCERVDVETYGRPGGPFECSLCMQETMGQPTVPKEKRRLSIELQREVFESLECLVGTEALGAIAVGQKAALHHLGEHPSELAMTNLFMLFECVSQAYWYRYRKASQ